MRASSTEIGVLNVSIFADGFRRTVGNQFSFMKDSYGIGEGHQNVHFVLNQENGFVSPILYLLQDLKDRGDFLQRHSGSGFVQQEHFRLQGEENADFQLALFSMGEAARRDIPFGVQQDHLQKLISAVFEFGKGQVVFPEIEPRVPLRLDSESHVFEDSQCGEDIGQLERPPDAKLGPYSRREASDVPVLEENLSFRRGVLS